ncbi:MAG: hypothetical protein ABMB14_33635, partial [Myxococcota bacterium]
MRTLAILALGMVVGCQQQELLPLVDAQGDLVGSYDPSSSELAVETGAASAEVVGVQVALVDGMGVVDADLVPGDSVALLDDAGATVELVTVGDADLIDGLSED